jgi:hypothetical protein
MARERLPLEFIKERLELERAKADAVNRLADAIESLSESILQLDVGHQLVLGRAINNLGVSMIRGKGRGK